MGMNPKWLTGMFALLLIARSAMAAGELHIYNWGNYTNPKLIEKFQKETGITVTLDSYDSNETMLSNVRAGGTGYDIVVPSDYTVKIMIEEGLLAETHPNEMPNYKYIRPEAADVYWDRGRHYTVPWAFGTTSFAVNTAKYLGDIDTYAILFDPPQELRGRINMLDDENTVIHAAERYLGLPRCGADPANLKKVNDLLQKAKAYWHTFSYDVIPKMTAGDVDVSEIWNGSSYRARQLVPTIKYAYPREGIEGFMDNVAVLKDAPDMENAKAFQNFLMLPENAALISAFAGFDNGIIGASNFLPPDFVESPEMKAPPGAPKPEFVPPCPKEVLENYNRIWANLHQ
jgi:spermidine/putrescine transport system substrate-binding protein